NLKLDLPDEFASSDLLKNILAAEKIKKDGNSKDLEALEEIIKKIWIDLYNKDPFQFNEEFDLHKEMGKKALIADFEDGKKRIEEVEKISTELDSQIRLLQDRINAPELLKAYPDQIKDFLEDRQAHPNDIPTSDLVEKGEEAPDDIGACSKLIEQLEAYRSKLIAHQNFLNPEHSHPIPDNKTPGFLELCKEILAPASEALKSRQETTAKQLEVVDNRIHQVKEKQSHLQFVEYEKLVGQKIDELIAQKPEARLNIELPDATLDKEKQLELTIKAYKNKLEDPKTGLYAHRKNQQAYKAHLEYLHDHFEASDLAPAAELNELYSQVIERAKVILTKQIKLVNEEIITTDRHIHQIKQNQNDSELALARMSEKTMKARFEEKKQKIASAFEQLEQIRRLQVPVAAKFSGYLRDVHNDQVAEVTRRFSDSKRSIINHYGYEQSQLLDEAFGRIKFLEEAKPKLEEYRKALASSGRYIPTTQVPKDELLTYLEHPDDEWSKEAIDKCYKTAEIAQKRRGFNWDNIINMRSHYTTILRPSDFDYDTDDLIEVVDTKLKAIERELTIDITAAAESVQANASPPSKLYVLQEQYQESLSQQQSAIDKIIKQEGEELAELDKIKLHEKQPLLIAKLETRLAELTHVNAQLDAAYSQFEYKLIGIEAEQQDLDEIIKENDSTRLLELIKNKETSLQQKTGSPSLQGISQLFRSKQDFRDSSILELSKQIDDSYSAQIKALEIDEDSNPIDFIQLKEMLNKLTQSIQDLTNQVSRQPEQEAELKELQHKKVKLAFQIQSAELHDLKSHLELVPPELEEQQKGVVNDFRQLQEKRAKLKTGQRETCSTRIADFAKKIESNIAIVERLRVLATYEIEYRKLVAETKEELNPAQKQELAKKIVTLFLDYEDNLSKIAATGSKELKDQLDIHINALNNYLEGNLTSIEDEYKELIEKAKTVESKDSKALNEEIHSVVDKNTDLLTQIYKVNNRAFKVQLQRIGHLINGEGGLNQFTTIEELKLIKERYARLNEKIDSLNLRRDSGPSGEHFIALAITVSKAVDNNSDYLEMIGKTKNQAILNYLEIVREQEEKLLEFMRDPIVSTPAFSQRIQNKIDSYFSKAPESPGIFVAYLAKRAETYWFKDFISRNASIALSCFCRYKTDAQEREEFVTQLESDLNAYQENPNEESFLKLEKTIDEGKKKFTPRASEGAEKYQDSLLAKLTSFEDKLKTLEEARKQYNQEMEETASLYA
ncbi:hypothetical protein, partial [Legionella sp.]|uniref:hypothetical protein n=1 Tax=Legionella sp. TaxID=459 RepID=UPI000CAF1E4A